MKEDTIDKHLRWCWRGLTVATVALVACLMLMGCTRKVYVPVENVSIKTDTLRLISARVDSVLMSDTVRIETRGDTVFKEVTKWRTRISEKHDTLYRAKEDTVKEREPYPVEVVKEVERKRRWWETALIWTGAAAIVIAIYLISKRCKK